MFIFIGMEFDPEQHEQDVAESYKRIARVALFDELIDYHLDGTASFDDVIEQYLHDCSLMGVEYP